MRKVLAILMMIVFISFTANAQKQKQPAKPAAPKTATTKPAATTATATTGKKHRRHKKEPAAQNFQVCKNNSGYYVCNQAPGPANSTHPGLTIKEEETPRYPYVQYRSTTPVPPQKKVLAPEPQSYPENIYTIVDIGKPADGKHFVVLGPFD